MVKESVIINNMLPLISMKDIVIFPEMAVSLFIDRDKLIKAINQATNSSNLMIAVAQRNTELDNPQKKDLYEIGTLVEILQILKLPDNTIKLLVKGLKRVNILEIVEQELYLASYKEIIDKQEYGDKALEEIKNNLLDLFTQYVNNSKKIPQNVLLSIKKIESVTYLVDIITSHLPIKVSQKQDVLEKDNLIERIAYINSILEIEIDIINMEKKIRSNIKQQMEKNQKDYYLNEQIKAIQKELNNGEDVKDELKELQEKFKKLKLTAEVKEKVDTEIKKLSTMNPISAEAAVVRNYLEWLLCIPWQEKTKINIDLKKSENILDAQHYGLGKVKERILEYLAVLKRSKALKVPILCLVGPPGVGKTSLARSIAEASGRKFIRISLGGVRDEAEIRGHRRTYIGAMPGKIIQSMKKVKVTNPLFLLDEVDKMGSDFRGDPSSALLEVLDPEQNSAFVDHYIEVEYNLSDVMFITTANSLNIQEALLDRMEVIELSGYTEEEKLHIAKQHLIPRNITDTALKKQEFSMTDNAILNLIRNYTRESGVRQLDREISSLARKSVKKILEHKKGYTVEITKDNLNKYAGILKYRHQEKEEKHQVGITTGLGWTRVGGEILSIEALKIPGKGNIKITGKLGEVMQESVQAAFSLVKAQAEELQLNLDVLKDHDIHIHVPEGATPKDGPSAGIAMATSIFSIIGNYKVKSDVAMTGEITLRGKVLAIGGLKEKILAAIRAKIKTIIIPKDNEKDLVEIPKNVLKGIKIVPVSYVTEVFDNALIK